MNVAVTCRQANERMSEWAHRITATLVEAEVLTLSSSILCNTPTTAREKFPATY
jgi:hypothetical protein